MRRIENKNILIKDRDVLSEIFRDDQIEGLIRGTKPDSTRGMKWSDETVQEALKLKFLCRQNGYNQLLKLKLPFPSLRTLSDRISSLKFKYGIFDDIIEFLGVKITSFKEIHKIGSLSIDEMSIVEGLQYDRGLDQMLGNITFPDENMGQKPASKALVFMVAGVGGRWKQVVGFHFTGNSMNPNVLKEIVMDILQKCHNIGLHIMNLTTDQAGINQALWKLFGFGKQPGNKNEIINSVPHPIDPTKLFYLFSDAPHALKNITQSLLNNKIITLPEDYVLHHDLPSDLVQRDHLEILAQEQGKTLLKLAPKFKNSNLNPQGFEKMRVPTSSNVMSKDVGAALNFLADNGQTENMKTTAHFVQTIDKWFKALTSRHFSTALCQKNMEKYKKQISFLEECIYLFENMKIGNTGYWKPCQTALIITTRSAIEIQKDLIENFNYEFVMLGRFTQDCLENLFSSIRAVSPKTTGYSFKTALRLISVSYYIKTGDGNYSEDDRPYISFLEQVRMVRFFTFIQFIFNVVFFYI